MTRENKNRTAEGKAETAREYKVRKREYNRDILQSKRNSWLNGVDFCLKYYRAPRYRVRYVMIVLVELKCIGCANK